MSAEELKKINIYSFNEECYVSLNDYSKLQQENTQLKKQNNEYKRLGFKHLCDRNNELEQQLKDKDEKISKAIDYFDSERFTDVFLHFTNAKDTIKRELKEILESNKED